MVREKGEQNHDIHKLAWDTFKAAAARASELKLYGAGQDILKTAFSVAQREAMENAVMLRRMGEFEPARLSEEEMEYTTIISFKTSLEPASNPSAHLPNNRSESCAPT